MNIPVELKYSKSHEWLEKTEGGYKMGLTDYAQHELGDIVFVNLPEEEDEVETEDTICDVESVKAVSDVYSPVTGTVCAINEALQDEPELINLTPYEAWIVEFSDVVETVELMSAAEYEEFIKEG